MCHVRLMFAILGESTDMVFACGRLAVGVVGMSVTSEKHGRRLLVHGVLGLVRICHLRVPGGSVRWARPHHLIRCAEAVRARSSGACVGVAVQQAARPRWPATARGRAVLLWRRALGRPAAQPRGTPSGALVRHLRGSCWLLACARAARRLADGWTSSRAATMQVIGAHLIMLRS